MRRVPPILWIAAGAALWGTDTVLRRPLANSLTPIHVVLYEHLLLAIVVLPILIHHRRYLSKLRSGGWVAIAGISWIGSVAGTLLFTYAVRSGNPTTAVLLQKVQPVFAIILARAFLGERWQRAFPIVVGAALIGGYLISFGGGNLLTPWRSLDSRASLLALAAAASWGSATVFGRFLAPQLPFELVTALRILCALPLLAFAAGYEGLILPSRSQVLPLSYLALVPGFAGLMLYYRGLRATPASHATIAELAFPATAALLNWILLGVTTNATQVVGFAIVWASIFALPSFNVVHLARERGT